MRLALALAICVTLGRGYFALGRDGLLPPVFARTSRHGTPWVGNLVVVVGCVGLIAVAELSSRMEEYAAIFGSTEYSAFAVSATAGSFAVEFVYLILAVAAFGLLARHGGIWWQYLIVAVAVVTPILGFYGALDPAPHNRDNPNWLALYWALARGRAGRALVRADADVEAGADPKRRQRMPPSIAASRRSTRTSTSPRRHPTRRSEFPRALPAGLRCLGRRFCMATGANDKTELRQFVTGGAKCGCPRSCRPIW